MDLRIIPSRSVFNMLPRLPDAILQRIEACKDWERLKAGMDRALDMKSLEEFDL